MEPCPGLVLRASVRREALCRSGAMGAWKQGEPVHVVCCYCEHLGVDRHAVHGIDFYGHAAAADLLFFGSEVYAACCSCWLVKHRAELLQACPAGMWATVLPRLFSCECMAVLCKNSLRYPKHKDVHKSAQLLHILLTT